MCIRDSTSADAQWEKRKRDKEELADIRLQEKEQHTKRAKQKNHRAVSYTHLDVYKRQQYPVDFLTIDQGGNIYLIKAIAVL